jgi:hypothetical protein
VRKNWYLIAAARRPGLLLFAGFTPLFAGTMGLALTVGLILGAAGDRRSG